MKYSQIEALVGKIPYIEKHNARFLYDLILKEKCSRILELGVGHGTATCYMAAALQELGRGSVTAVDLIAAKEWFTPSAEEQFEMTGLSSYVDLVRMQTGYTWFLHDEIQKQTESNRCRPVYDLCIIDGPKNWTIDGATFFMVDKLLRNRGWIIFDDYNWTYANSDKKRNSTDGIVHREMSEDERNTPHIREVFELLVKQHPDYTRFALMDKAHWALAQKKVGLNRPSSF